MINKLGYMLNSTAMKASHHASGAGNCVEFLTAVQPEIVVVTVGPSEWGYPSEKTMTRLRDLCPVVLQTDEVGDGGSGER